MTMETGSLTFLKIMATIALIGALNWGLIGLFNWNLVDAVLGGGSREETSVASRVVYSLVGVSGALAFLLLPRARSVTNPRRPPVAA